MENNVIIEQIQLVDEVIKSTFEGQIVKKANDNLRLVYKNQGKLYNLIFEKHSDDEIAIGTLSNMNVMRKNQLMPFSHSVEGFGFNLQCKLKEFTITDNLIEVGYDLLDGDNIISQNLLRIIYKS